MTAFAGCPRTILGTGDQVSRETPEENLAATMDEARRLSPAWRAGGRRSGRAPAMIMAAARKS
jgi:hypothetical protein